MLKMLAVLAPLVALVAITGARAQEKPVLNVYTYESFTADWGPGPKVEAAFEEQCQCDLQWVALADGVALLNRLKLEGADSKADVVLGLDTNLTVEASATGLFAPSGVDVAVLSLPGSYTSDIFVPYDYAHFAIIYDSEALTAPPASLKALVDGEGEGKIVLQDPRTSTPGLGFLLWMKAVYGDEAPAAWAKLKDRILTVTPGWSEAYGLFTQGEAPMVLSYTTSPAYHRVAEETDRYKALTFPEGHPMQIEVAARLAASKQPELAQQFLSFVISDTFQNLIGTTNWMLPVTKSAREALPDGFDAVPTPTTIGADAETVAANRKAWIEEWLESTSR